MVLQDDYQNSHNIVSHWVLSNQGARTHANQTPRTSKVDLKRGVSDLGEQYLPQIQPGYYSTVDSPTQAGGATEAIVWC